MTFKAGTYKQLYQYKSFLPSLLANPFEWRSDAVLEILSDASRVIGELNAFAELVPDVNFFIEMHKVKEATTSSRIEGTQTNIDEAVLSENNISSEKLIRINFTGKRREKAITKWQNYFLTNEIRMQYSMFKNEGLPQGSGSVESGIRRVINLRLKSCGSFWKRENAEIYLFLRSQLISGRWNTFFHNLTTRSDLFDSQVEIKSNHYLK